MEDNNSIEVSVIPESRLCGHVGDTETARLSPGSPLLCCLGRTGELMVGNIADSEAQEQTLHGTYSDFAWEEVTHHSPRLLAVGSECELKLYEVDSECPGSISITCVSECSADSLVQIARDKDLMLSELVSLKVLWFVEGRCRLLLNTNVVLQLLWEQGASSQTLSCCSIALADQARDTCCSYCVCRDALFLLTTSGVIYVYDSVEGRQLASVDLPAYLSSELEEEEQAVSWPSSSSFSLLQVSADLSTAVAATQSNAAVAIDLNHYFRRYPEHLLCRTLPSRPSLRSQEPSDQESLSSSSWSCTALGTSFTTDRSWEARLTSMYNKAKTPSPYQPAGEVPWFTDCPYIEGQQVTSQSRVPPGGATIHFSVSDTVSPALLTVSEFSAVLTFVSPGNVHTTIALWDLQTQSVSYHRPGVEAVPVQRSGEEQHSLLLKTSGLSQVLFAVSQEELLNKLMVFGSAGTVDSLCHLNAWGRCSIPLHALQAGLKNHQLDTVDFFLKSKANMLCSSAGFSLPEESADISTDIQLKNVQELCAALDLLCSAIRETHTEGQSRQFSEQLLNITLSFLSTQVCSALSSTHMLDGSLQQCVEILDGYITELRSLMKRYPWPPGAHAPPSVNSHTPDTERRGQDEWNFLTTEEVVQQAVLTNQIPRAQAYLRGQNRLEQSLQELRTMGLGLAFTCLRHRDLPQASQLLRNMGFSVKKQLHRICLYTDDKDLRDFVVEELSKQSYLSDEELQSVAFIKDMETLGSLPATCCSELVTGPRVLQMAQADPAWRRLLEELVRERSPRSGADLWSSLRLDWVRHWDEATQRTILLSQLQDPALSSCDSAVLWRYLTSLHDQSRVVRWIQSLAAQNGEPTTAPQWPALTADLVNDNTCCSTYLREHILNMLARRGLYTQVELVDFEKLLWRLGRASGVMQASPPVSQQASPPVPQQASPPVSQQASPPVPQYRSLQGQHFHNCFIYYCLDNSLRCLLYTYLEHYRLTPRNCPVLANPSLYESHPWFEMLVKMQEITRERSDPERVFQASLTSAQVLLPGSQASVSSMLLEGHSLLALGTIMFTPGGIDQVVSQGDRMLNSVWRVDAQLMKMALSPYPKLRAALFPVIGPRGITNTSSDVSIYHLMQSLYPLDPSRLFGWQSANTLSSTETSELPHFSSPHLVNRYALLESLDFLYFLRHGRASFAFATFLIQHLAGCSDPRLQLARGAEQTYSLAIQHFNTASVTAACVCFCQLLGVCSLKLRVDLKALGLILNHRTQSNGESSAGNHVISLVDKGCKLVEADREATEELLADLEAAVRDVVERKAFSRWSYEAGQEWAVPVQFCQLHSLPLSSVYLCDCAASGQWLHFLLFVQMHSYPPQQVRSLAAHFGPALQAHLMLAFQDLQLHCQWRSGEGQEEEVTGAQSDTLALASEEEGPEPPRELFQVLLQSQEEPSPARYLLGEAVGQRCPTLTVLAACLQEADLLQCLCVWVLTSVDEVTAGEATAHLDESPRHHMWNLHDLSIIWKTLLRKSKIRPLLQGFQLFHRESPLIHVLSMYKLCYDYKNYPEAKGKLLEFQRCLVNLRSSGAVAPAGIPLQWVECQASVLLLTMMQQCSTQYELRKLLKLLADMERLLKSNGPDFKKLSQLSQVLQDTPVCLSLRLLESYSSDALQAGCHSMMEQLQAAGLFTQARQVAELAGLPIDSLVISELLQDLKTQRTKHQWERRDSHVTFWRKCHNQFRANSTNPEAASEFFRSQATAAVESLQGGSGTASQTELLSVQERCLLYSLAGHWLSFLTTVPVVRLEDLEKRLWAGRVRQHVLLAAIDRESMFALPLPPTTAVAPEVNSYEAMAKEFSFLKIPALNQMKYLSLEGLPCSTHDEEGGGESALEAEEQRALAALVDQLLDEGCIHEASRACHYFSLYHHDMWVVLRCRGLASGELNAADLQDATSHDPPKMCSASSASLSSVSSTPEDQVVSQLQMLMDNCRHGKSYCKQVLSLYELSKELQCSFSEISAEEPQAVLSKVLLSQQPERYKKAQAFISIQGLQPDTVAQLVSTAVVKDLLAATHEPHPGAEGREGFLQLAKLCGDPNLVGIKLLDHISTVPLSELGCTVELLILSHDCFSLTCNMEGIVRVLQAARHLSHTHLAHSEHGLLVRLLTGIGRYNDMTYIFDLLNQNHHFEMLLRKKVESNSCLKTALLDYIKRCLPGDSEKYNMVALCFSMRREIGENHELAARTQLKIIESQPWVVTPELKSALIKVLTLLKDAAESYSKDSCVRQAARCVKMAKLVTLQLHFLNHGLDQRVVNLRASELLSTMVALPRCYQAFVLSEAYDSSPDWAEILYQKVILNGDFAYLKELRLHRPLTASLFEDISKKLTHHNKPASSAGHNLKRALQHCDDVYTHYKLAYEHKFFDVANILLQDSKTSSYLNDRLGS